MSIFDDGDDLGLAPHGGKDITDPAGGAAETRGGESPAEWQGPLPDTGRAPSRHGALADWCGDPACGGD